MEASQLASLQPALFAYLEYFRPCFKRRESFGHCQHYVLGLLSNVPRKSVEPIALAAGKAPRTLQEFLAFFAWDHARVRALLQQRVAERGREGLGVLDASGHLKRGDQTPGVAPQYCGETGKVDNCVVGQHLLYVEDDPVNPFSCMLASDLFLPAAWGQDRVRCQAAGIPDPVGYRPKWRIGLDQVQEALGRGIRFRYLVADEDYGRIPQFWFGLDALGQRGIAEVPPNFFVWATRPACRSGRAEHAAKRVDHTCTHSPVFRDQPWQEVTVKDTTRGPAVWRVKAALVHLADSAGPNHKVSVPTDRRYWLIVGQHVGTTETKYWVSNAPPNTPRKRLLQVALGRWHVEKWFERAKQACGLGAFEVRTYQSLIRHWICTSLAMGFLAEATQRLRGEKSGDHAGAGGPGGGGAGGEDLEPLVLVLDGTVPV